MKRFIILFTFLPFFAYTQDNVLSAKEKQEGWKLLFDGKSSAGWHTYNAGKVGEAWKVDNGSLYLDISASQGKGGGDIVTDGEFENYEFSIDWKIEPCGNSGIIFNVMEKPEYKYSLIASPNESVKPAGEWNTARIVLNHGHLELWLNAVKQVETTMFDAAWEAMIKGSKFKDMPDFGKSRKGHVALQDHGNKVWFKNIKVKVLK